MTRYSLHGCSRLRWVLRKGLLSSRLDSRRYLPPRRPCVRVPSAGFFSLLRRVEWGSRTRKFTFVFNLFLVKSLDVPPCYPLPSPHPFDSMSYGEEFRDGEGSEVSVGVIGTRACRGRVPFGVRVSTLTPTPAVVEGAGGAGPGTSGVSDPRLHESTT